VVGRRFWTLAGVSLLESIIILVGLVLLVVPGIVASTYFLFSASIVVVEGLTPRKALRRSASLIRGSFWKCLGIMLVVFIPYYVVMISAAVWLSEPSNMGLPESAEFAFLADLIGDLFIVVVSPIVYIFPVLLYYDLRSRKENFDIEPIFTELSLQS
jgi:hypothetical protein